MSNNNTNGRYGKHGANITPSHDPFLGLKCACVRCRNNTDNHKNTCPKTGIAVIFFAAAYSVCFLHEYGILCFVFLWCLCMKRQACWIGYVIGYICSDVDVFVEAQNKPVYSAIPFYYCWARFIFYSFPFQQWFSVCFLREFLSFVNC